MSREETLTAGSCAERSWIGRHFCGSQIAATTRPIITRLAAERLRLVPCLQGLGLVVLLSVLGEAVPQQITPTHLALVYLLAVLLVAIRSGLWPALIAAVASVAALDFFFIPPFYSFEVNTSRDLLLLIFLSVGAVIAADLAARLREQVALAKRNAETTAALCDFAGRLAGAVTLDAAIRTVIDQAAAMLPHRIAVVLGDEPTPTTGLVLPLQSSGESVGVIAVAAGRGEISDEERRLLEALTELAGIAIGRQILGERLARLGIEQAADRLRSALLNSIAHDLTAPIASVATALASLTENYQAFDDTTRRELIADAEREAERLHQFSANLTDMARIESGVVELRRKPTAIGELIDSALIRGRMVLEPRRMVVDIPLDLPQSEVDFVLIEQALFHILENAGKYTPPDTAVTIVAERVSAGVAISIADEGPGFPAEDRERIFTKFYRAATAGTASGTGLGLAICRGFIEAHGGTITAANCTDRSGAIFTIVLPVNDRGSRGTSLSG